MCFKLNEWIFILLPLLLFETGINLNIFFNFRKKRPINIFLPSENLPIGSTAPM